MSRAWSWRELVGMCKVCRLRKKSCKVGGVPVNRLWGARAAEVAARVERRAEKRKRRAEEDMPQEWESPNEWYEQTQKRRRVHLEMRDFVQDDREEVESRSAASGSAESGAGSSGTREAAGPSMLELNRRLGIMDLRLEGLDENVGSIRRLLEALAEQYWAEVVVLREAAERVAEREGREQEENEDERTEKGQRAETTRRSGRRRRHKKNRRKET
jgi:hypothetical protein